LPPSITSINLKLALPKGNLLQPTSKLLDKIGLGFNNYNSKTRLYRLQSTSDSHLAAKIFQERDIPVQVAVGNYDIGICGTDWIDELTVKFPESPIIKIMDLEYDVNYLYLASSRRKSIPDLNTLKNKSVNWRIVSEYPNITENVVQNLRLRRFRIFQVWGSADVFPPENADLVVIKEKDEATLVEKNLYPVQCISRTSASLVVNRNSWQKKSLSRIISLFTDALKSKNRNWRTTSIKNNDYSFGDYYDTSPSNIYLALPDGHQMTPASEYIINNGLKLKGYEADNLSRRPVSKFEWLKIKVIRPQDMPLQVANGNFDIAITGHDWYLDHIYCFPSSPVIIAFDLDFGAVRVVAVVNADMPANSLKDLKQLISEEKIYPLRVASEYVNITDHYLHNNHIAFYKVIPTWGATEALLPEDADLLIENTQTGKTLEAHNLKIIDTLFSSTACVILNKRSLNSKLKKTKLSELIHILKK
jgi:ATP phosphoribosyltransferase